GVHPIDMAQIFASRGFRDFAELSLGNGGIFRIDRFQKFILSYLGGIKRIEDLPIPLFIGATNLDDGVPVAFSEGEIGPRMIASCSIPIVFKPVQIDGSFYVDGGVLRNHPAWILRDKCDFLIGVNVSPLRRVSRYDSIINVALRTYNLMAKANQQADMNLCDISVQTPEIASYAVFDLKHIKEVFISGYIHTRKALRDAGMWKPQGDPPLISAFTK
ncbi:MAG: patatin-like phospholipase family protein, partial [Muribaculaceae bacterium]|nr:patatin-like phospholipase family protein [Muribaculaceae bacterium]